MVVVPKYYPIGKATGYISDLAQSFGAKNVKDYGAIGDGSADDTIALQATFAAVSVNEMVIFPPGKYKTVGALNPADWTGVSVLGLGKVTIEIVSGFDITLFSINKLNVTISNIDIKVPNANTNSVIKFTGDYQNGKFHDITIYSSGTSGSWNAIEIAYWGYDAVFRNINIMYPKRGIYINTEYPTTWCTANIFNDICITGFVEGIKLKSAWGNIFTNIQLIHLRPILTFGIYMVSCANNTFCGVVSWNDGNGELDTIYAASESTQNSVIGGYVEGRIIDAGVGNIFQIFLKEPEPADTATWWLSKGLYQNFSDRNLLTNGNFEVGTPPTGVIAGSISSEIAQSSTQKHLGAYSLKVYGNGTINHPVTAYIEVARNLISAETKTITFGCWVYVPSINTYDSACISIYYGTEIFSSSIPADDTWHWIVVSKNVADSGGNIMVNVYVNTEITASTDIIYVDGAKLVEGPICSPIFSPFVVDA